MKAMTFQGPGHRAWIDVPKPKVQNATDALVKITATTICGTDLHILKGDVPNMPHGRILGHEGIGIVEEVGSAVTSIKKNDRVLISCITSCAKCTYCVRGLQSHCVDGGWRLGNLIDGTQAEYVRIPHADTSLYTVPDTLSNESLICLSDALPTGFEVGVLSAKVQPGDWVAVVGAGPVGMSVLMTAQLFSPAAIIMVDTDADRLRASKDLGATFTINLSELGSQSVMDKIEELKASVEGSKDSIPPLQRTEPGVDVAIECVGVPQSIQTCQEIIAPGGRIANVGVHGTKVDLQLQDLWIKNISLSTGLVSANTTQMLLKTLIAHKLQPEALITHKFKLSEIDHAYDIFSKAAEEKAIKMLLEA